MIISFSPAIEVLIILISLLNFTHSQRVLMQKYSKKLELKGEYQFALVKFVSPKKNRVDCKWFPC